MEEGMVLMIHTRSGQVMPLNATNVAKALLEAPMCPCVATDPKKKQECKLLIMDLKTALEDEMKAMGEYHLYSSRSKDIGFDPILPEVLESISKDEREHKEFLEIILKNLESACQ